jgi:hypothetical protein
MNTLIRCPKCGDASTDPEYCSECGAPIAAAPITSPPPAPAPPPPADASICADCAQPRPGPLARYCDNCRYDFVAGQSFSATPPPAPPPPDVAPEPAATPPADPPPASAPPVPVSLRWDLIAAVDPSLRKPEDPEPTDLRERIFPLDLGDCLIGRRSDKEDIHPEIPIGDPGISRRHARLIRQPDGGIALLDLGSMNGTRLNGKGVEPNILTPIGATDQVTLGCWTRLTLRPR